MKSIKIGLLSFVFLTVLALPVDAQKKTPKTTQKKTPQKTTTQKSTTKKTAEKKPTPVKTEPKKEVTPALSSSGNDEQKVKDIVSFLQFVLNTLGSSATSSRDKDVLITQSYAKIFRDDKVQIEDDLDASRQTVTNKDVVAYLKDVDFFFEDVKFELNIESITASTLANGNQFYKVTTRRVLTGKTTDGESVNHTQPRFIEINFNPDDQDLKIVSIYTSEFNEKEALTNWWKELSYEWSSLFRRQLNLIDSVQLSDIKKITALESLDLHGNPFIKNIEPLGMLSALKTLNLSSTGVTDLTPIRNLTELETLNISSSPIEDLTPLRYAVKMRNLDLHQTPVGDIAPLEKMLDLETLDLSNTKAYDFSVLSPLTKLRKLTLRGTQINNLTSIENLTALEQLDLTKTLIQSLDLLKNLKALQSLTIDSTRVNAIGALSSLESLKILSANNTSITDLAPLQAIKSLEKVYCDHAPISRDKAQAFTKARPDVLIVFDSKDLKAWWDALSSEWQSVFRRAGKINVEPTKENLAAITTLDSINISGNPNIIDIEPVRRLLQLSSLNISRTVISDLSPLEGHRNLERLDISGTPVSDIFILRQFSKLKVLRADETKIENLDALFALKSLTRVYADHTALHDITAQEFLQKNPKVLLVYKTHHISRWWSELSTEWKEALRSQMGIDTASSRENMHSLLEREKISITDAPVRDLSGLKEFIRLKDVQLSGTAINAITPLENLKSLQVLKVANSPLQKIGFIHEMSALQMLDISNTPVDELDPLQGLDELLSLNCAGTQIKKLDPLEHLDKLETIDCSNTKVSNLSPLEHLPLKTLKCYNTKVSAREVEKLKNKKGNVNVVFYK